MPIVPVKKVTIITFNDIEEEIIRELGRIGVVDLRSLGENEIAGFHKVTIEHVYKYRELLDRLNALKEKVIGFLKPAEIKIELKRKIDPYELESKISLYEREIDGYENRINYLREKLKDLEVLKDKIKLLERFNIDLSHIGEFKHIYVVVGILKAEELNKLKEALRFLPRVIIKEYRLSKRELLVLITSLSEFKDNVRKVLTSVDFEEIIVPKDIPRNTRDAMEWLDREIEKIRAKINELEKKFRDIKKKFADEAPYLEKVLKYSYTIATAQNKILRSKMMSLLQGWIPEDRIKLLDKYLSNLVKSGRKIIYYYSNPAPDEKPPTVLRTPRLFKAYLSLVRQYGVPDPYEMDPTLISGLFWTIMFGFMFPDLGQGLVIMLLGILFVKSKAKELMGIPIKSVGKLMIGAGIVAAITGALIGDVFLSEEIIHPLLPGLAPGWLEKASNVIWLIKIAIFFGIIEISVGLLLATYNHLKKGHIIEALLGEKGIAGLLMFLSMACIAFAFIGITIIPGIIEFPGVNIGSYLSELASMNITSLLSWPEITLTMPFITLLVSIMLIIIKSIIEKEEIALTFGMIFESVISSFSNMLSFVRLAGFNVSHAALAIVISKMLEVSHVMGFGMLIFLNIFTLTLELVIVMIQALRLVFYEFMTKFYSGSGQPFKPFRLVT